MPISSGFRPREIIVLGVIFSAIAVPSASAHMKPNPMNGLSHHKTVYHPCPMNGLRAIHQT
jgi:hypothetical protein